MGILRQLLLAIAELRHQIKRIKNHGQQVIKFDIEFLTFVVGVRVMDIGQAAQEVDELWESKLIHALLVSHSINDSHERLGKDDAKHLVGYIQLALTG